MYRITFLVLTISLVTSSCSNTDSNNINSPGIYADFDVKSDGSISNVVAQLKVGGALSNTVLELSGGDQLIAYNGSASVVMTKDSSLFGDIDYRASFLGDVGGTQYTITFNRPSTSEVINSSVTLPEDFSITSNYSGTYTSADTLYISWAPASPSDITYISLVGICGSYYTSALPGISYINIPLSLITKYDIADPDSCSASIKLSRSNNVPVNAQFGEGGSFYAKQERRTDFIFAY